MVVNHKFKEATDFLKKSGIVKKLNEVAAVLSIDENLFGKYRFGQPKLYSDDDIILKLIEEYPETLHFFEEDKRNFEDKSTYTTSMDMMEKLVSTLEDLLKHERVIRKLEKQIVELEAENAQLRDQLGIHA